MNHYDIIIIGTGAGGGTLARKLAPTGKSILILERGDFLPKEIENWDPHKVYTLGRYRPDEKWKDVEGNSFSPFTHYCVGGNTKVYGAALLRLRESDFFARTHKDGATPGWPISYKTFEPYYSEAEKLYSTHGERRMDPTEPYASEGYPFPALTPEPDMKELFDNISDLGHRPSPIPIGVRLPSDHQPSNDASVLSYFDGYPDPTEAKADSHVIGIKAALAYANVRLVTGAKVTKLKTNSTGRFVTKVEAEIDGFKQEFAGSLIVVSCGAINSAALLLRSYNDKHPRGLANGSDLVGRNLMLHNNGVVIAITEKLNKSTFQKSFLLSEFYHGTPDFPYPLGTIQLMGKNDPDTLRGLLIDQFGDQDYDMDYFAQHSIDFFITTEDLPKRHNRILINKADEIQLVYQPNNIEAYQKLHLKLRQIMDTVSDRFGYGIKDYVGYKLGISGVSHQTGTCRFGYDAKSSVLDLNCKTHELDNLYVVDTSFFPSSGAVNPSLTAMANALRVGDHLIARLQSTQAPADLEMASPLS